MHIAALDLGTTGCRTYIYDLAGSIVASDYQEWPSYFPKPSYVEQDANIWWDSIKKTMEVAIKKSGIPVTEIVSLSCTNQRETIVPIDKDGNPLHNAIVWQDRRSIEEVELIRQKIGAETIHKITGLSLDPYFSLPSILWIKYNKPEIYEKTWKFMLVNDFIIYKLTGECVSDYSNLSRTQLFDINNLRYSDKIASELEMDLDKMPEPVESGVEVGEITSHETCFDKKMMVCAGAGDQMAAALGVGVTHPGDIKCTTGTGSFILAYLDEPKFDPQRMVLTSCGAIPGTWVQESAILTTGAILRWFRDEVGYAECSKAAEGQEPYELMTAEAAKSPIGANGLLITPHFQGAGSPHWNSSARGLIFGLALGHQRRDLYRAVLEGVAYEVKKNIEVFKELGITPKELKLTGGGSRSDLWNQIISDVLGITCVRNIIEEATSLGAAILAAVGAGLFPDIAKAADNLCKVDKKFIPNEKNNQFYNKMFQFASDLYKVLDNNKLYHHLQKIVPEEELE